MSKSLLSVRRWLLSAGLTTVVLASCGAAGQSAPAASSAPGQPPPASKAAAQSASPAPSKTLTKMVQAIPTPSFGFLPLYVALDQGFFRDEGIQLETPAMASSAAAAALLSGEVDFSSAGSGIRAAMQGAPAKAIFYYYNTTLFELVAAPDIKSVADLKGKKVGSNATGGTDEQIARIIIQKAGLDPAKDVTFLNIPPGAEVATLATGAIQAMVLNPDLGAKATTQGYKVLVPVQEVGRLVPSPFSGFMATNAALQAKPDLIKAWLRANVKALKFVRDHPDQSGAIAATALKLEPAVAQAALPPAVEAIDPNDLGGFTEDGIKLEIQNNLTALKGDAKVTAIDQLVDLTLLHQAQKEVGLPCKSGYQCS